MNAMLQHPTIELDGTQAEDLLFFLKDSSDQAAELSTLFEQIAAHYADDKHHPMHHLARLGARQAHFLSEMCFATQQDLKPSQAHAL